MPENRATAAPASVDLAALIRGRRSIDLFQPEPVGTDVLLDAIELARWAPNHRLTEPWRFYVLGPKTADAAAQCAAAFEAETKGERAGAVRLARFRAIPGNFVVTSKRSADALLEREDYAACCCAVQNLMLYLWHHGIGVKWTTGAITREQRLYDVLGLDSSAERIVGFFGTGTQVVPAMRAPRGRGDRRQIAVTVALLLQRFARRGRALEPGCTFRIQRLDFWAA
jgi:nitroreductase